MLSVLRQRNFALLWFGQLISLTGDYVLIVALPFYTYQLTGSVLATGVMFLVQALPGLFLGSLAGVFVDRWDRRWTMIASDLLRAGVLLFLLLVRSRDLVWIIYAVAFTEQVISLFFIPAKGAVIPNLVEEQHLMAANSLNSTSDAITRLVDPADRYTCWPSCCRQVHGGQPDRRASAENGNEHGSDPGGRLARMAGRAAAGDTRTHFTNALRRRSAHYAQSGYYQRADRRLCEVHIAWRCIDFWPDDHFPGHWHAGWYSTRGADGEALETNLPARPGDRSRGDSGTGR